jgi:Flp pilus assembly CpaE family ATPase
MANIDVAIVTRDPRTREIAARTFGSAPESWTVSMHDEPPPGASVVVAGVDMDAIEGAVVLDPSRPEQALDMVAAAAAVVRPRTIVVTAASGGVGVTTVALHLCCRAARRQSTCYLDLDGTGGAADRLGLVHDEVLTWDSLSTGRDAFEASLPVAPGFRALISPPGDARIEVPEVIDSAAREFDSVVIDSPSSQAEIVVPSADAGVLVIPPTAPGAARAARFLDRFPDPAWALVSNRLGPGSDLTRHRIEQQLGRPLTLELPCCALLRDAEDEARLLASSYGRWLRRIDRLARALLG